MEGDGSCRCVACGAYLSSEGEEVSRSILLRITTSACYKGTQVEAESTILSLRLHIHTYIYREREGVYIQGIL